MGVVVALGDEPLADLARDVGLGAPDQATAGDLGDDPVGGVGGLGQQRDLVGVLDDPQLAQDRRGELELGLGEAIAGGAADGAPAGRPRRRPGSGCPRGSRAPRTIEATSACASSASSQVTTGR